MSDYFWWAVTFVYTGIGLILLDLWLERWSLHNWIRGVLAVIVFGLAVAFSVGVVFKSAPVMIDAYAISVPHLKGTMLGGVVWDDDALSDLRVWIRNPTAVNYQGVDLVVDTDEYIVKAGQLQIIPACTLALSREVEAHATLTDSSGKASLISPPIGRTWGVGYRVLCEKFPAHSAIQLVIAAATDGPKRLPKTVTVRGTYNAIHREKTLHSEIGVVRE
jgi:hypothetical protein